MPHAPLPYALETPVFPFRHLAALAGRAPIGGAREVALACFMAARLAADRLDADDERSDERRTARSGAARSWLGTLTLPPAVRGPLARCVDSAARATPAALSRDVAAVAASCASFLDAGSRAELTRLAQALG